MHLFSPYMYMMHSTTTLAASTCKISGCNGLSKDFKFSFGCCVDEKLVTVNFCACNLFFFLPFVQ